MRVSLSAIEVVYSEENGWEAWEKRRQVDAAPDKWPYGLDGLARYADGVKPVDVPRLSRSDLAVVALRGPRARASNAVYTRPVGLAWDERTALRMAARSNYSRMVCGVIWGTDDYVAGRARARNAVTRRVLRGFDKLWCLSQAQVGPTVDWLGVEKSRVSFIPFGIDPQFWSYKEPTTGQPLIVSVGNDRDRDPESLFAALDMVVREIPDARALVQTDSHLTAPKGVQKFERVSHRELHELYCRSTLVMVATRPNLHVSGMTVALEAMSTGRPVVMTSTPGMEDYVPDGVVGRLATPGDAEALAASATEIITSRPLQERMGLKGRQLVERELNSQAMVGRIARFIAS